MQTMISKLRLHLKWAGNSKQLFFQLHLAIIILLLVVCLLVAFINKDVLLGELSKALCILLTLNFFKLLSKRQKNLHS